jgi:pyrroloquinoline-quinone synthase
VTACPACLVTFQPADYRALAEHLCERADQSDADHVRWLNQQITRKKQTPAELEASLRPFLDTGGLGLAAWSKRRFIERFFGRRPHPFVLALQHPTRAVLLGYVFEHQHFLRQWVRSCAFILARSEQQEVAAYEIDNLNTEFGGFGTAAPAHYELLLRMGEALGEPRERILSTPPLPRTRDSIAGWDRIAQSSPWVAAMAAMHCLELIAHRDLMKDGATLHYFDPAILVSEEIPPEAKAFLREGYEADVGHAEHALELVEKFAREPGLVEEVQATFLRSVDLFDDYLMSRLERAEQFEAA